MDIDGWLRGIGLAQYAEIFPANDIDGELFGRSRASKADRGPALDRLDRTRSRFIFRCVIETI